MKSSLAFEASGLCSARHRSKMKNHSAPSRHRVENEYDDENDFREKTQIATTLQFLDTTGCVTGSRFVLEAEKDRMLIVLPDYLEKLICDTVAKQQVSIGEKDLPVVCCSFYNLPSLLIQKSLQEFSWVKGYESYDSNGLLKRQCCR
jgi:hypothetical protein